MLSANGTSWTDVDSVNTSGMFNQLYLKLEDPEPVAYRGDHGWKILIHDRSDAPTIDVRTHGTTLIRGWARDIRVYVRQVLHLWLIIRCTNRLSSALGCDCLICDLGFGLLGLNKPSLDFNWFP